MPTPAPAATTKAAGPSTNVVRNREPLADATYESRGNVRVIKIPVTTCANVTSTPIVVGEFLLLAMHDKGFGCQPRGPYANALLGYHFGTKKLYTLAAGQSTESTLLFQPEENLVYWTTVIGGTTSILDAATFATVAKVEAKTTSDSSGTYLDGLFYFGTVNTPSEQCQQPINPNCGAIFAVDRQGAVVRKLNTDNGFRTWVAAGITTDGQYLYVGGSPQTKGNSETEYFYGCSTVKLDKDLRIVAVADPGDRGCHRTGLGGAEEDAVAGEPVLGPDSVWVRYMRPVDARNRAPLIRYDRNLVEQCRVEPFTGLMQAASFYGALTVDRDGNAYVPYTLPSEDGERSRRAVLWRVTPKCEVTELAVVPNGEGLASPTLADDEYVLFATPGKLSILRTNGEVWRTYPLGSDARVTAAPVIHDGIVYVLSEDATLTIIEGTGLKGYGSAYWPRYRRDNQGSGSLVAN